MLARSLAALIVALAAGAIPAAAQQQEEAVRPLLTNVSRVEVWSFFDPLHPTADSDYVLVSNRARLAMRVAARRISFEGSFQYAQLVGLPRAANDGFGPLGPGASYFAAARTPEAYQLYLRSLSLTLRDIVPQLSLRLGRMDFTSGEDTPFAGRLIGGAEWTPFERAFDGVRLDYTRQNWRAHVSFFMPTQGAFEESASPTIGRVQLTTARWMWQGVDVFAHRYRDWRAVPARPDNTGRVAKRVDINVKTYGATFVHRGLQFWGAWQHGDWYGEPHRGFSVSGEFGHQWSSPRWQPFVRGGALYASGDRDPNDRNHGTFFPMLPTTAPHLLRGTFALMNLRDVYGMASLHPRERVRIDGEVHYLSLANGQDRWYSGTGATAFSGDYFGFSSRRSALRSSLGTYTQLSVSRTMLPSWVLTASVGIMRGGDVIRRQFVGSTLFVAGFDSVVSLP